MKRSALVLLLLVPFVMAPRISLVPADAPVTVEGNYPRQTVKAGSALPFKLRVQAADAVQNARVAVVITPGGQGVDIVGLAKGCQAEPAASRDPAWVVTCNTGPLAAGKHLNLRVIARPLNPGRLTFDVTTTVDGFDAKAWSPLDGPVVISVR